MKNPEQLVAKIQHFYEWMINQQKLLEDAHFECSNELQQKELETKSYAYSVSIEAYIQIFEEIIYKL